MSVPHRLTIVSGGQTGVDRGALDAALIAGTPCDGWCPEGRKAEDGRIPDRYPLKELPGGGYTERTRKNVEDSDGTLIITFGPATGGTARTVQFCQELGNPHFVIDATVIPVREAAGKALDFIHANRIERMNVAGPRASTAPEASGYARDVIGELLARWHE